MQQLSVHEYYDLGKKVDQFEQFFERIVDPILAQAAMWPLFIARHQFSQILKEPCALLPASQRAARAVTDAITSIVPEEVEEMFKVEKEAVIHRYRLDRISNAIKSFETVLNNDMPEMSTFAVAQIGIFRTEDLIHRSYLQIDEELRALILPLAMEDITEAGKCIAFRLPTAAAFHMSRAIETGMNQYFEVLTGKPFDLEGASRNWFIKTEALKKANADDKITEFLTHIRKVYRNPITHPDVILETVEAFNFFSQAISVISMMLSAVKSKIATDQPLLPGIVSDFASTMLLDAAD